MASARPQRPAPITYHVALHDTHAHLFRVTLRIERPQADQVVSVAAWIPGSYLIREFARHLSHLEARQGRRTLRATQLDKASWSVPCREGEALEIGYLVYAFDTSVRAAYLDARRGFFNGTSLFLRAHGHEHLPHALELGDLPKGWQAASALPALKIKANGSGHYRADDYDELVDHPFELGTFWRGSFKARGVLHEFVVSGALPDFDGERLLADARRICEAEIGLWHGRGKPPFKHYVFMLNAVEDGYGGLEHRASTALIASRKDLPRQGVGAASDGYVTLLGLISHEYFHTWNVKRLKPSEFAPYDYSRENHTELLWFFEGFTSYFDDLILLRAGLIDPARYVQLVAKSVNQVLSTPGRRVQSLARASWDAWIKYYRPDENSANATVSYYAKGALVGLCLDLRLRQHGHGLDELMRALYALARPITERDILDATQGLSDASVARELREWVQGTDDLPLKDLLADVGVEWREQEPSVSQRLGCRLQETPAGLKAQQVLRGGAAQSAGLAAGDELLALDDWRVRKSDDLHLLLRPGKRHALTVARDQRLLQLRLHVPERAAMAAATSVRLELSAHANAALLARRDAWLARA